MGHAVTIGGIELLDTGPALVHAYHGNCKKCKRAFSWTMKSTALGVIIEHLGRINYTEYDTIIPSGNQAPDPPG
jgi:hypothetical protein